MVHHTGRQSTMFSGPTATGKCNRQMLQANISSKCYRQMHIDIFQQHMVAADK